MPDSDIEIRRASRERDAKAAFHDFRTKGTPFVLYLRKYDIEVQYGDGEFGDSGMMYLDTQLVRSLGPGINVVSIQDQKSLVEDVQVPDFERLSSGLRVGDDWQAWVSDLIFNADMIVQDLTLLSEGCRWEMQKIHELRQNSKTVVVIPAPDEPFAPLDAEAEIKVFGRCIYGHDAGIRPLVDTPQAADLVKRLRWIAANPQVARTQPSADQPGDPPVTYEGVVQGLMHEAEWAERLFVSGPDRSDRTLDNLWHRSVWSRYRACGILQMLAGRWKTLSMREAVEPLLINYLIIAELCTGRRGARSFPDIRSRVEFGHRMLINALLTQETGDPSIDNLIASRASSLAERYAFLGFETFGPSA